MCQIFMVPQTTTFQIVAALRNGTVECWNVRGTSLVTSWDLKPKEHKGTDFPLRGLAVLRKRTGDRR